VLCGAVVERLPATRVDFQLQEGMVSKPDWSRLSHTERIRILAESSIDQIAGDYVLAGSEPEEFRKHLARERELWEAGNVGDFEYAGDPPNKEIILGAWRDLERSEALLELLDNSIDAWLQRREKYPAKTAPELSVYIDIDADSGQLTYEDNAGGVPVDRLANLVVPGYSDTGHLSRTIGSYKTGGKKAIFRLATAARITTRYWNPAETGDEAVSVQLDRDWVENPIEYKFPYARLINRDVIERGQTRYVLQLRAEPLGAPWYEDPDSAKRIINDIRLTYTLLMTREPSIRIHYRNRQNHLTPLPDLYEFSGTKSSTVNIEPQKVTFDVAMSYEGKTYPVEIEVILGCRTTTATREGKSWGIDLYGNDRLFVAYDQETFADVLPRANAQRLIRGLVNIRGANVFIPWDTHKRHLNLDRDIIRILQRHKLIRELFENWQRVYNGIASAGKGQVTELISKPLPQAFDGRTHDLFIPHRARVSLDARRKRGIALPASVYVPTVRPKKEKPNDSVKVSLTFTTTEARGLASHYGIKEDAIRRTLADEIKQDVLKRARRS
jgi:hypothetical protein